MDSTTKNYSYFFKYITSSDREQRLRIPKAWSSIYGRRLPCSAYLRNIHGDIWVVTVTRDVKTQTVTFEDGWSTFVANNKVEHKDKIVFEYGSMSTFRFKLFGKDNDEKEYIRPSNSTKEEEVQLEDVQAEPAINLEHTPDPGDQVHTIGDSCDEEFDVDEFADEDSSRKKKSKKRASRINEADEEAVFRKAGISRPENPYFVTKRRSNRSEMYIPIEVIRDFELMLPEEIVIRDEKGLEWKADVKKWKDGRLWLSKGWRAYCKHNNVKMEDWCIIEFVKPEEPSADFYIKTRLVPSSALKAARRS